MQIFHYTQITVLLLWVHRPRSTIKGKLNKEKECFSQGGKKVDTSKMFSILTNTDILFKASKFFLVY